MEDIRTHYPGGFFAQLKYKFSFYVGRAPLNLQVEKMRFYERGDDPLPERLRKYTTRFPQQTTRYIICEVYLSVVRYQPSRMYTLSYSIYRPDGSLLHKTFHKLQISDLVYCVWRTFGYGWPEPGTWLWRAGEYQAEVLLNGVEVARERFSIEPPPPPPPPKPPTEVLQQRQVRFYASWIEASPTGARLDSIRFPQQTTREVICELTVRNLLYQKEYHSYTVTVQWCTGEGRLLWEEKRSWTITSQEQEPSISWGCQTSGWNQGIYRVEILIDGQEFAWGAFTITGSEEPPPTHSAIEKPPEEKPSSNEGERLVYRSNFHFPNTLWDEDTSGDFRTFRQEGYYHIAVNRAS